MLQYEQRLGLTLLFFGHFSNRTGQCETPFLSINGSPDSLAEVSSDDVGSSDDAVTTVQGTDEDGKGLVRNNSAYVNSCLAKIPANFFIGTAFSPTVYWLL
jgi:hypothetical protein